MMPYLGLLGPELPEKVALCGHNPSNDLRHLVHDLRMPVFAKMDLYDTQVLILDWKADYEAILNAPKRHRHHGQDGVTVEELVRRTLQPPSNASLENVLKDDSDWPSLLHNAGNDAWLTAKAAITILQP